MEGSDRRMDGCVPIHQPQLLILYGFFEGKNQVGGGVGVP
jgi:hypothetical protein